MQTDPSLSQFLPGLDNDDDDKRLLWMHVLDKSLFFQKGRSPHFLTECETETHKPISVSPYLLIVFCLETRLTLKRTKNVWGASRPPNYLNYREIVWYIQLSPELVFNPTGIRTKSK